jgi:hypothetical protein
MAVIKHVPGMCWHVDVHCLPVKIVLLHSAFARLSTPFSSSCKSRTVAGSSIVAYMCMHMYTSSRTEAGEGALYNSARKCSGKSDVCICRAHVALVGVFMYLQVQLAVWYR